MIKGLAITPPVIGRISIGKLVQKQERWLPEKDDSFSLTTQVQSRDGWLLHPLHQALSEQAQNGKIRAIPIQLLFNDSELNLRAEYSAFDRNNGRPVCVGNGETARRVTSQGMEEIGCAGPDRCPLAKELGCKLYGRLNVQVEGQQDELGSFIFRTTGYNSVRTLAARLKYYEAASGGNTKHLPLLLRLRAKSTTQSHRTPVYYVDLTLRDGQTLAEAVSTARKAADEQLEAGIDTAELEQVARLLLQNGQFEDTEEEVPQLLEEFYPAVDGTAETEEKPKAVSRPTRLTSKLGAVKTA